MSLQLQFIGHKGKQLLLSATNTYVPNYGGKCYTGFNNLKKSKILNHSMFPNAKEVHFSTSENYPLVSFLPLPKNIEDIDAAEKVCFSPERNRDISGPVIMSKTVGNFGNDFASGYNYISYPVDPHIASYDCTGAVSLNSCMQTMVPQPFSSEGKPVHLNMPGGQWGQGYKYVSEDLQNCHYRNITPQRSSDDLQRSKKSGTWTCFPKFGNKCYQSSLCLQGQMVLCCRDWSLPFILLGNNCQLHKYIPYSTSGNSTNTSLTSKEKLKIAMKEYGGTVIVFHVCISLLSLSGFYLAVSSGIDVGSILKTVGGGDLSSGASTFVIAYALHKMFAPFRMTITLVSAPFIVRYIRKFRNLHKQ